MTVRRLVAATLFTQLLLACACPPFASTGTEPASAKDKLIASDEGLFQASDLVLQSDRSGSRLSGSIKNDTGKLWEFVDFEVTLRDASGTRVTSSAFTVRDLAPGQAKRIGASGCERIPHPSRERPAASFDMAYKAGELATAYVFALTKPAASGSLTYSDEAIHIVFRPTRQRIGFTAVNHSAVPMKIDWSSAAFVDTAGRSHRIIEKADRAGTMAPTIMPPGARVTKSVYPSDAVPATSGRPGSGTERPIFPNAPAARALKGKSFSVVLPIETAGKVQHYEFGFVIIDVVAG
jgi:hypothetical protein